MPFTGSLEQLGTRLDTICSSPMPCMTTELRPEVKIDGALINAGGVRAPIDKGQVTRGEVLTTFPLPECYLWISPSPASSGGISSRESLSKTSTVTNHDVTSFVQVSKPVKCSHNPFEPHWFAPHLIPGWWYSH